MAEFGGLQGRFKVGRPFAGGYLRSLVPRGVSRERAILRGFPADRGLTVFFVFLLILETGR